MNWRDRKKALWAFGLLMPGLAFIALGCYSLTGSWIWLWAGPIFVVLIVPIVDLLAGKDPTSPPDSALARLEAQRYYAWMVALYVPLHYGGLIWSMYAIARWNMPLIDRIGLAVTLGFISGVGINAAHELGHKRDAVERWLSKIALAPSFYGHFHIEHNRGHHSRVATPVDPASARMGESFYTFWPRTVFGSIADAWRIEAARLHRDGKGPWRFENGVLNAWLLTIVLWSGLCIWLGIEVLPYLVLQALIGLTLLELVNYLEHYGMLRQRVGEPGSQRYEQVQPRHSWNANNIATNVLLYHLQRHSDHHVNPTRRYQALRDYPEAPQLPTGYAGMILIALVPPLWFRMMDPRVIEHMGDIRRANLAPRRAERLLARYSAHV